MENNNIQELYTDEDKKIMQIAEDARIVGKNRVEEIKKFARLSGYKRIGIANCVALQKEADKLKELLSDEFDVFTSNCKIGRVPSKEILGYEAKGLTCNPVGQAHELSQSKTELNITLGLCMGHDILFNKTSKAPVTTLVVKDREFNHNSILALQSNTVYYAMDFSDPYH